MLRGDSGLQRRKDGVLITTSTGGEPLPNCGLAGAAVGGRADALMHITREGKLPLSVLILPVPKWRASWISGEPVRVLLVFDPERKLAVTPHERSRPLGTRIECCGAFGGGISTRANCTTVVCQRAHGSHPLKIRVPRDGLSYAGAAREASPSRPWIRLVVGT